MAGVYRGSALLGLGSLRYCLTGHPGGARGLRPETKLLLTIPLGVGLSVASSVLFGILYYFSTQLHPLTGTEIFGWRIPLTMPFLTIFMLVFGEWKHVREIGVRLKQRPALFPALCLSSALLAVQQWLFLWAPINGAGLSVSLGYFLLPLTLLLVGRIVYRERLSVLQVAAALSAALGVIHQVYQSGGVSWATALVALGFPTYFALRRKLRINNLGGLWFDMLLMCPAAFCVVLSQSGIVAPLSAEPRLFVLLPLLAIVSAAGFMTYILASRLLPFSLFGLLGYVEPVLLFAVAIVIGEGVRTTDLLTYAPIVIAVVTLAADGLARLQS